METLDNPVWHALTGPHRAFARGAGRARSYDAEVAIFSGMDDPSDADAWADLVAACAPAPVAVVVHRDELTPPDGFTELFRNDGVQQVLRSPAPLLPIDLETRPLAARDVPAMLALVAETVPGPFNDRTIELGGYVGVFDGGALVAMAGRRFGTDDTVEVSGVCTTASHRGRGIAAALTARVAADIQTEGRVPFLHTIDTNEAARRVYDALGFERTGIMHFVAMQAPTS